ncbi:MAG: hypothetical protein M4579_004560 [Chaenotheca gracillima]|nr:MAG: hypothetical protein M4579_004560 [Chaenotheca gracillima]
MNNINNMASMNAAGGPVGGGVPMMNNGVGMPRPSNKEDTKSRLNTYIYDYLLNNELYDTARAFTESGAAIMLEKGSPGRRRDANNLNNGVDDHAMDTDPKVDPDSKIPDDLPTPRLIARDATANSFLFDWWGVFWDLFVAQRSKGDGTASQYLQHTQQQQRLRQEHRMIQQLAPPGVNPYLIRMNGMNGMNGMNVPQDLQRRAVQNNRNATPQHAQMAKNSMMSQMQREGSQADVNGEQRPHSPSSAENAPSPSKRPRLENGAFNPQMMANRRAQPPGMHGMQGQQVGNASQNAATMAALQANQVLINNGINPNQLTAAQFNAFQSQEPKIQEKSIQVYAQNLAQHTRSNMPNPGMQNGIPPAGMSGQGSPMMGDMPDGQVMPNMSGIYAGNPAQMRGMPIGAAPTGGNHALQDYQQQLMLLEQQNKKRLLMARQEQEQGPNGRVDQLGPAGQPGFQGMSPQGSRSGPSPNPQDQMKRGTPKMNQQGLPGSPMPDGSMPQNRGSPAAMAFNPGQMPGELPPGLYQQHMAQLKEGMPGVPGGAPMRPPSSHPQAFNGQPLAQQGQEALRQQAMAAGRIPSNPNWQQGAPGQPPMLPQNPPNQQGQPQPPQQVQMGTPQQRAQMPPPQAPPAANNAQNKTQPSSPQQPAAPPTPQQSNKANPKKGKEERTRKKPVKKGSTSQAAGAASSEAEPPPTPTPSTPITPVHSNSFNGAKGANATANGNGNGNAAAASSAQPQTSGPAASAASQPMAQTQQNANQTFAMDGTEGFDPLNSNMFDVPDILETFDFDSFLNTDETGGGGLGFDMNTMGYPNQDGVEAGNGEV